MKIDDFNCDMRCMEKNCNKHARYFIEKKFGKFIFVIRMCDFLKQKVNSSFEVET